jgi:hypothetical protein
MAVLPRRARPTGVDLIQARHSSLLDPVDCTLEQSAPTMPFTEGLSPNWIGRAPLDGVKDFHTGDSNVEQSSQLFSKRLESQESEQLRAIVLQQCSTALGATIGLCSSGTPRARAAGEDRQLPVVSADSH